MRAIEMETVIPPDGELHINLGEAPGRKVRVILLFEEDETTYEMERNDAPGLMDMAGKIRSFREIKDAVSYQQQIRDEWTREWDE